MQLGFTIAREFMPFVMACCHAAVFFQTDRALHSRNALHTDQFIVYIRLIIDVYSPSSPPVVSMRTFIRRSVFVERDMVASHAILANPFAGS